MKIAFVGAGAAGRALARLWLRAGHEIGAVRTRAHSAEAVAAIGAGTADGPLEDAAVVVFATPDDALAEVAGVDAVDVDGDGDPAAAPDPEPGRSEVVGLALGNHELRLPRLTREDEVAAWPRVDGETLGRGRDQ